MKDLSKLAGLPIALDERTGRLHFGGDLPQVEPAVRTLDEMREVLMDPGATGPAVLYYMYRDVARPGDRERLHARGLRYDLTVIPPARLGREYTKTAGHYHPLVAGAPVTYPEIYEVLHGTALYLLQKPGDAPGEIADAVVVEVGPGERLLIPPGYGHITINAGDDVLVMSNLVEKDFKSLYEPYRQRRGGCYYCVVGEDGEPEFVVNQQYGPVAELRMLPPTENPAAGLVEGTPLYTAAVANPDTFLYLVRPQDYPGLMDFPELDDGEDFDVEDDE